MSAAYIWARRNLFRSVGDTIITLVIGAVAGYALFRFLRFVLWTGRWDVAQVNLSLLMTGAWPTEELWRIVVTVVGLALLSGLIAGYIARGRRELAELEAEAADADGANGGSGPGSGSGSGFGAARVRAIAGRVWPAALTVLLLLALARTAGPWLLAVGALAAFLVGRFASSLLPRKSGSLLVGGGLLFGLAMIWLLINGVELDSWGGLMLNLFLAAFSITLCFPFGVLAALGRRSSFPVIRWLCTAYIELFRGVPLIALLLMAHQALRFFVPESLVPGSVVRAIVVFVLFTGAYVAEIVRGGLQSVPTGQIEAGRALGMSPISVTGRIVLPQALRNVIPAMVGQFISLFKDTTLAGAAMGLTELLNGAEVITRQPDFVGQRLIPESLVFVLLIFWAGSYTMSNESQQLETRLGVGVR